MPDAKTQSCCDEIQDESLRCLCSYIELHEDTIVDCLKEGNAIGFYKTLKEFPEEDFGVYIEAQSAGFYFRYLTGLLKLETSTESDQLLQTLFKLLEFHQIKNRWKITGIPSNGAWTITAICDTKKADDPIKNELEFGLVLYDLRVLLIWLYGNEIL